jgi:ankyrin repeat protein
MLLNAKCEIDASDGLSGSLSTPLLTASHEGHLDVVKLLISSHANIKHLDNDGWSALSHACKRPANHAIVSTLIDAKANVNVNKYNVAPLNIALQYNSLKSCELLISAGAHLDSNYERLLSPLYEAIAEHNIAAVKMLISAKADINCRNTEYKFTPLLKAIIMNNADMVDLMLSYGADATLIDSKGFNCLHMVVAVEQCVKAKQEDPDYDDKVPIYPYKKITDNYAGVIQALVDAKADSSHITDGITPLMYATGKENLEVMEALLAAGADTEVRSIETTTTKPGSTALFMAVGCGFRDGVSLLIEAKADVNATLEDGYSPIMIKMRGDPFIMVSLLSAKADVNHMAEYETALDIVSQPPCSATCRCYDNIMPVLEEFDAKTWMETMKGESEFVEAAYYGDLEFVNDFINHVSEKTREHALVLAVLKNHLEIVKSLLSAGTNPSCLRGGTAPLLVAADKGYTAIAKALLDAGADTSTKVKGETAAKRAGRHRYKDIVTLVVMKDMERRKREKEMGMQG